MHIHRWAGFQVLCGSHLSFVFFFRLLVYKWTERWRKKFRRSLGHAPLLPHSCYRCFHMILLICYNKQHLTSPKNEACKKELESSRQPPVIHDGPLYTSLCPLDIHQNATAATFPKVSRRTLLINQMWWLQYIWIPRGHGFHTPSPTSQGDFHSLPVPSSSRFRVHQVYNPGSDQARASSASLECPPMRKACHQDQSIPLYVKANYL